MFKIIKTLLFLLFIGYCFKKTDSIPAGALIKLLHFLFIMFIILGPFILHTKLQLQFYLIVSGFTMIHWILMQDKCALTLLEQFISGRHSDETFIGKIVKPVYNITSKEIFAITMVLFIIVIIKYLKIKN
jgi:hypothetical protein